MRSGAGVDGNGGPLWLAARAKSKWPCATRFFPAERDMDGDRSSGAVVSVEARPPPLRMSSVVQVDTSFMTS